MSREGHFANKTQTVETSRPGNKQLYAHWLERYEEET